jgi:myo-inositol-1(or 4)-monophosphatase
VPPDELLSLAATAARSAGDLLRARFAAPRTGVGTKSSSTDMVSDADRAAETLILDAILSARPGDAVLGEETGERAGASGLRWVIDPLDGTTNFLFGIPHFSVSIACEDENGTFVGVVHDVMRDETFAAARAQGATCNGVRISVSDQDELSRALISTGFSYLVDERTVQAEMDVTILPRVRDLRRFGSAALDFAWTAYGRYDGYFEAPCFAWDGAAGELLVREAGGRTAPMRALGPSGPGWIAAGPNIFDALRALVEEALARRDSSDPAKTG